MMHPLSVNDFTPVSVALMGVTFFAALYVTFGLMGTYFTRILLPRLHIGSALDPRPLAPQQVARELRLSTVSILIFGIGMLMPWWMIKSGWAIVWVHAPLARILLECIVLLLWNDIHFYAVHRLLHHPKLFRRLHWPHHQSIVTTPWTTYAFHPVEALLLGSVLIPPMWLWNFSLPALMALPVLSLTYNSLGHANYQALPRRVRWLSNAHDHHLHHACFRGNFGFLFKFMDQLFGTALPPNAADTVIAASANQSTRKA